MFSEVFPSFDTHPTSAASAARDPVRLAGVPPCLPRPEVIDWFGAGDGNGQHQTPESRLAWFPFLEAFACRGQ